MSEWKNFSQIRDLKTPEFSVSERGLLDFQIRRLGLQLQGFHIFILGGTGAGKSTFFNLLAGERLVMESPVRPASDKVSVYLHQRFSGDLSGLNVECYYHERKDFPQLVLWDFPDFDSYVHEHHELAVFFREYADLIFLILHPEKLHQQSCLDFLTQYPEIPVVRFITHAAGLSGEQRVELEQHCREYREKWGGEFFLVDLIDEKERAQAQIYDYISIWKKDEQRRSKRETAEKLKTEAVTLLKPFLSRAEEEERGLVLKITELQSREQGFLSNLILKGSELYERRIFSEISHKLRHNLLFTDPSYFAELFDWWHERKKQNSVTDNFPLALPYLLWEDAFGAFQEMDRELFLLNHHRIITEVQGFLVFKTAGSSIWRSSISIIADYLSVLAVGWYIFSQTSFYGGVYGILMQLLLLVSYVFFIGLLFILRVRKYEKSLFFHGRDLYQRLLSELFRRQLEERKISLSGSLKELRQDLEIMGKICR